MRSAALAVALGCFGCAGGSRESDTTTAGSDPAAEGSSGSGASSGSTSISAADSGTDGTSVDAGPSTDSTVVANQGSDAPSRLTFDVTTMAQGGKYAPKNVGAIWIEDSSGAYVRSLEVWAGIRKRDLRQYVAAVGGRSDADVTTSATLRTHRAHEVRWDLKDYSGNAVDPGQYTLIVEVTDRDGAGQSYSVDFDTSAGTGTLMPASSGYYAAMTLKLE